MSRQGLSTTHLESFSYGLIAVIIILTELRVPVPDGVAGLRAVATFLYA